MKGACTLLRHAGGDQGDGDRGKLPPAPTTLVAAFNAPLKSSQSSLPTPPHAPHSCPPPTGSAGALSPCSSHSAHAFSWISQLLHTEGGGGRREEGGFELLVTYGVAGRKPHLTTLGDSTQKSVRGVDTTKRVAGRKTHSQTGTRACV